MASASERITGYEDEFISPVPEDYICPICHLALRDPQQIASCGHRYCEGCLEPILRNEEPLCPLDRDVLDKNEVFQDLACKRAIESLAVKCPNFEAGCAWEGELREVKNHSDECLLARIGCVHTNCEAVLSRGEMQQHVEHECPWRVTSCQFCEDNYPACLREGHFAVCVKFPLQCVNTCGLENIPREEMTVHLQTTCFLAVIACQYEHMGCEVKISRNKMHHHIQEAVQDHLDLACKKLESAQVKTDDLSKNLKGYEKRLSQLEVAMGIYERGPNRDEGKLLWRITNYSQHWEAARNKTATSIESDPFYSGRYGYKMTAALNPNGDAKAEGKSVSVYISIIKGKYDSLLPWPFRQKIKFSILSQTGSFPDHNNIVLEMVPDVNLDGYKRPVEWKNPGVGIWNFASHEKITSGDYIVDDTLFAKIEVEPFDVLN